MIRKILLSAAIVVSALLSCTSSAQDNKKFPALNITEWISGGPGDIGKWGDGKVYVVELWGTWCKPCIENIPKLTALQKKYKDKGLVVIGYSWEKDADKLRQFVKKMGEKMQYTLVNDSEEKTVKYFSEKMEWVEGFPYSFVIDKTGKLIWKGSPSDGLEEFISGVFK